MLHLPAVFLRSRTRFVAAAAGAALVAGALAAGATGSVAAAAGGEVDSCNIPIRMTDGVTLRANAARPGPGKHPTVLTITGYNKDLTNPPGTCPTPDSVLTKAGYNVVYVDDRGTGSSEGRWDVFGKRNQQDYAEVLKWLEKQPWQDGNIGLYGGSYLAITSLFTAESGDPHVKAVWADVPMSDAYRDVTYFGGNLDTTFMPVWFGFTAATDAQPARQTYDGSAGPDQIAFNEETRLATGGQVLYGAQLVSNALMGSKDGDFPAYDGPSYRTASPVEHADRIKAAVFWTGGWFDIFQRGEANLYNALKNTPRGGRKWVQGPIYHTAGDLHFDAMGLGSQDSVRVKWFDHWLRGRHNGIDRIDPLHLWQVGAEKFETSSAWPLPTTRWTSSYLSAQSSGSATGVLHDGSLTPRAPSTGERVDLPFTPAGRICDRSTIQWAAGSGAGTPCETDERAAEPGTVTYTTSPLTKPLHVAGPITLDLWAELDRGDASLYTALTDVAPDGTSTQITSGGLDASFRALDPKRTWRNAAGQVTMPYHPFTLDSVEAIHPNDPYEYQIEIYPTDWVLAPGHRLRLVVGTADTPHFVVSQDKLQRMIGGTVHVLGGPRFPSHLLLPVQPR